MSSTSELSFSHPNRLWSVISGARGPGEALAVFLGGLVLLLAFVPGVAVVRLVVLHPFELIERVVNQEPNALFIVPPVLAGIATGLWQFWFRRGARSTLRRLLQAVAMVIAVPAVLFGSMMWIEGADFNYLLLTLGQSALLFSVLWLARAMPPLVASAVNRPLNAAQDVAIGLAGNLAAPKGGYGPGGRRQPRRIQKCDYRL